MTLLHAKIHSSLLCALLFLPMLFACGDPNDDLENGGDNTENGGDKDPDEGEDNPIWGGGIVQTTDGQAPWYIGPERVFAPKYMNETQTITVSTNVVNAEVRLAEGQAPEASEWAPESLEWKLIGENEVLIRYELPSNDSKEARSADYEIKIRVQSEDHGMMDSVLSVFTLVQDGINSIEVTDTLVTTSGITLNCKVSQSLMAIKYAVKKDAVRDPLALLYEEGREVTIDGPTVVLSAEGLAPASAYWLYAVGVRQDSTLDESTLIEEKLSTAFPEGDDLSLIFRVSANPANEYTVHLPMADIYEKFYETGRNYQIDWGDGQVETGGAFKHQYKDNGKADFYQVKIKGQITTLNTEAMPQGSMSNTIFAVEQWGNTGLTKLQLSGLSSLESIAPDTKGSFALMESMGARDKYSIGAFEDCTGLKEIPEALFDYAVNVRDFNRTFLGCTGLTAIPEKLFAKATKAKSFELTFYQCKSLTRIPEKLFANNVNATDFDHTFGECAALTAIPQQLFWNNAWAVSFEGTFKNCTSITEIPEKLLKGCPHATTFGNNDVATMISPNGMFTGCTALAALPADLMAYCPEATDISAMFYNCNALRAVPEGFLDNNTRIKYCNSTFKSCKALESIPVTLFDHCLRITQCEQMFYGCQALKGESPYLMKDNQKVHLYERESYPLLYPTMERYDNCFYNCSKLTDYADMPSAWK